MVLDGFLIQCALIPLSAHTFKCPGVLGASNAVSSEEVWFTSLQFSSMLAVDRRVPGSADVQLLNVHKGGKVCLTGTSAALCSVVYVWLTFLIALG